MHSSRHFCEECADGEQRRTALGCERERVPAAGVDVCSAHILQAHHLGQQNNQSMLIHRIYIVLFSLTLEDTLLVLCVQPAC